MSGAPGTTVREATLPDGTQTLDVGNSSIGIGRWQGGRITVMRVAEPAEAASLLIDGIQAPGEVLGIAVSMPRWQALEQVVAARGGAALRRLTGVPLPVADSRLATSAGADRLAAALGALPGPGVVVDAGTAVTVDVVDAQGVFRGGFIAAGPSASLTGLALHAPALPKLERTLCDANLPPLGLDTVGALSGGAWGLAVGGVDRLVDACLGSLAGVPATLWVTGGWGAAWLAASRHGPVDAARGATDPVIRVSCDETLVHRGIARWAAAPR